MSQLRLIREELRLKWEIATHELQCLADDGAGVVEIDAKFEECRMIKARRDALENSLLMMSSSGPWTSSQEPELPG